MCPLPFINVEYFDTYLRQITQYCRENCKVCYVRLN